MICSINDGQVASDDCRSAAPPVSTSHAGGPETVVRIAGVSARVVAESPRTGGCKPIGELLQQVLDKYQLVGEAPAPPAVLRFETENACHAPSLSLS